MMVVKTGQQVLVLVLMGVVNVTAAMCTVMHDERLLLANAELEPVGEVLLSQADSTDDDASLTIGDGAGGEQITNRRIIEIEQVRVVWDTASLRMYCLIGASLGGVLAVGLMPDRRSKDRVVDADSFFNNPARKMALKFFCSAICGVLVTPLLLRHYALPLDSDYVMAFSGLVSASSIGAFWLGLPFIEGWAKRRARAIFNLPDSSVNLAPKPGRSSGQHRRPPTPPTTPGLDSVHHDSDDGQ